MKKYIIFIRKIKAVLLSNKEIDIRWGRDMDDNQVKLIFNNDIDFEFFKYYFGNDFNKYQRQIKEIKINQIKIC